ncbi:MAG TPA: hypothetical protein ENJ90_04845 [Devosia sp.]|nr:hypothetical protein [Devosia sp.]
MLSENSYLRVMRASAWYDLVVTFAFATPWTVMLLFQVLFQVDAALDLPGIVPRIDVMHVLFANLMGSVVIVWSVLRLHLNLAVLGRYDAAARFLFAVWQSYALLNGASWVLVPILVVEIVFGVVQALPHGAKKRRL